MSSQAPVVSVLMTAFNRDRYIAAAIESVLTQTFTDFELVVVDDCSRDSSVAVARRYESDPRVRVVVNERNRGDYPNRNHAVGFARGRYFKFHDSDDVMYAHCLEVMLRALEAIPEAGLALSAHQAWSGAPCPIVSTPRLSYRREFLGFGMFSQGPSNALFRTDVFRALGGFPEVGPHSDLAFWLRVCRTTTVALVPADLYWYRVHGGQHLQTTESAFDLARAATFSWEALNHPQCPLLPEEREVAKRNYAYGYAKGLVRALMRARVSLAVFRIRHSPLGVIDWLRYLRPPKRSADAGVPMAADPAQKIGVLTREAQPH